MRQQYSCFDKGLKAGSSAIYKSEMPGGQFTNLQFQARSLGLGDSWIAIEEVRAAAGLSRSMLDLFGLSLCAPVSGCCEFRPTRSPE